LDASRDARGFFAVWGTTFEKPGSYSALASGRWETLRQLSGKIGE
jgi:hypothetical protein